MKRTSLLLMSLALLPLTALAASPFDGTWKTDFKTGHIIKNAEWGWEIKGGMYRCTKTCYDRTDEVATDGKDHPVKGHVISDHLAVELQGDATAVLTYKKGATLVARTTLSASPDGMRLTQTNTDYTGAKPVENTGTMKRVGKAEPGAHKASGVWAAEDGTWTGSEQTVTFESKGDGIRITQNGVVIDAKFDGKDYPSQNDPGHALNSFKKNGEREFAWTTKLNGKVWGIDVMTLSADGQSLLDTYTGVIDDTKNSVVLRKTK